MATGPDDGSDGEDAPDSEGDEAGAVEAETGVGEDGRTDAAETEAGVDYEVTSDDRTWGILVHASALAGLVVPFGNILAPLVIWLVKREESQFVDENGTEVLNFQITWTVLLVVVALTILVGVGVLLLPILGLVWLILVILGTVRASEEEVYDYPLTVDLIS